MSCWQTLGIAPTTDETLIKQAYAARIREHRPDRDPAGFRRARAAYEEALARCRDTDADAVLVTPPPAEHFSPAPDVACDDGDVSA